MSEDRRTQQVSLGCGTLILIALIVIIFGRGEDVEREVTALRSDVRSLTEAVEEQTKQITALQQMVRQMQPDAEPQPQQ